MKAVNTTRTSVLPIACSSAVRHELRDTPAEELFASFCPGRPALGSSALLHRNEELVQEDESLWHAQMLGYGLEL
jgi:hypothetical protein